MASVRWAGFGAWACVGLLGALGIAALLTIGLPFLLLAAVLTGVLASRRIGGDSLLGLAQGAAAVVGYIGWLNRGGPGPVCHTDSNGMSCLDDAWNPWPFFAVAAVLAVGSVLMFVTRTRRGE